MREKNFIYFKLTALVLSMILNCSLFTDKDMTDFEDGSDVNSMWPKRIGGLNYDSGQSITSDSNGNIITAGFLIGDADMNGDRDFNDGQAETSSGYGDFDVIIVKFDSTGIYQWSKRLGGTDDDRGYGITTDLNGNIYVTGYVNGNADMNGDGDSVDGGAESSTGYGSYDIFIVKFNSSGVYQWAKRLGRSSNDMGYNIISDLNNNIIVTGHVNGNADMNGDGDSIDGGAESSTGYGLSDVFIVKFDSSGTYQWSKRLGGTNYDKGYGVSADSSGNILAAGYVTDDADMNGDGDKTDGGAESSTGYGSYDIFIVKFNSSGAYQWSKRLGGSENDYGRSIAADFAGNVIITGNITGDADINGDGDKTDGGAESSTGYGNNDVFIVKFNSSGSYQWSKRLGGSEDDEGKAIITDSSNNILTVGYVTGDADMNGDSDTLDNGAESSELYGFNDIFISKFSPSGIYQLSKRYGSAAGDDYAHDIATCIESNVLITGFVGGYADLNGDGDYNDGNAESPEGYGISDIYIIKNFY